MRLLLSAVTAAAMVALAAPACAQDVDTGFTGPWGAAQVAGFDCRFGRNVFARGEYRCAHYGDISGYDNDVDHKQCVAGLGFRF